MAEDKFKTVERPSDLKTVQSKVLSGVTGYVVSEAKSGLKAVANKADPFSDGIDITDVTDTGAESIRLARQTVNQTASAAKTTKQTVKKTAKGIKTTAKAAQKTVKASAKGAYKTAVIVKNATVAVGKAVASAVTHVAAAMTSPIFWIIAAVLLVVTMLSSAVAVIMGGASNQKTGAVTGAVGLGNVPEAYIEGVEFYNTAIDNAKNGHNALIEVTSSYDLIFMSITKTDGSVVNYNTAFAEPWQKDFLKSVPWTYPLSEELPEVNDVISIAYILLQKRANEAAGTKNQIYDVDFTQEIFDEVISASVTYNSTAYANQLCMGQNCDYWIDYGGNVHFFCHLHTLYAIGVWYYTADDVMSTLGFTAYEKQWTAATKQGFETNPNINLND